MQISGNISGNSVSLSSSDQQITSATAPAVVGAGSTLTVTVYTVGYNPGDTVYWSATGTTVNSTGSGVVSNSLGIIGTASLAVPISSYDIGTIQVFILKSQASSVVSQTAGPVSINQYYGWFAGGYPGSSPLSSIVARIDFSNDNVTPSIRAPLPTAKQLMASTGNASYGWFGWGTTFPGQVRSDVLRIDWANDSPTAPSPRADGAVANAGNSSAGNANYGWFALGSSPTVLYGSRVDRLDYANDTNTTSPRGAMPQSRTLAAGVGTANYGWFGGGYQFFPAPGLGNTYNTLEKIDYANDTAAAINVGNIGSRRRAVGATGNANYGWFGGGFDAGTPTITAGTFLSTVTRIDYSNNTQSTRGSMISARDSYGATGNAGYGYFANGPNSSRVDRIDYSNDAVVAISRSVMSESKSLVSATSSYEGTF
jgi:hypothetical protein